MAQNWIKMRSELATDPRVIKIAGLVDADEFAVVGRLHCFWSWADAHLENGHAEGVTFVFVDRLVRCDGFAEAMVAAGWLAISDDGLEIPDYETHLSKSAKRRGKAAKRQATKREKDANRHAPTVTKTRPEKEKEKEKDTPPKAPKGGDLLSEGFDSFWQSYPRKAAKAKARVAYGRAVDVIGERLGTEAQAVEFLNDVGQEFAKSDLAGSRYCPHPATWLAQERYDDNPAEWDEPEVEADADEGVEAFEAVARIFRGESSRIQYDKSGAFNAKERVRVEVGPVAASTLDSVGSWSFFKSIETHNRNQKRGAFSSAYKVESRKIRATA